MADKAATSSPQQPTQASEPVTTSPAPAKKALSFSDTGEDSPSALDSTTGVSDEEGPDDAMEDSDDETSVKGGSETEETDENSDEGDEANDDSEDEESEGEEDDSDEDDSDEEDDGDEEEGDSSEEGSEEDEKLHSVKVNGKVKKYSLKQMKQLVSSGAHLVESRAAFQSEMAQAKKGLTEETQKLKAASDKITPAWQALGKGDIEGSLLELANVKGVSKLEARRKLREQMLPVIAERLGLSSQEVNDRLRQNASRNHSLDIQEENEFLKTATPKKVAQESEGQEDGNKAIREFQIQHGVSDGEVGSAVDWLLQNKLNGDKSKLTFEDVQAVVFHGRVVDKALEAIQATKPRLIKDQKFVNRVVKKLNHNPDWSIARASQWIRAKVKKEMLEQKDSEATKLAKDVGRKVLSGKPKSSLSNPGTQQKKPMSFRDMDDGLM